MSTGVFEINYGSDLAFDIPWPDGAGGTLDLTGWTISLIDVTTAIAELVTATSATPASGVIRVDLQWAAALKSNTPYDFRVQIGKDGAEQSTNLMRVIYR